MKAVLTTTLRISLYLFCVNLIMAEPAGLKSLREAFEIRLAQYESEFSSELGMASRNYLGKLEQLATAAQKAGNFEAWQEADKEMKRFRETQQLPETAAPGASGIMTELQQNSQAHIDECWQRRLSKVRDLAGKYKTRLESSVAEATRKGAFKDAAAWQAELQRLAELPLLQKAAEEQKAPVEDQEPEPQTETVSPVYQPFMPAPPPSTAPVESVSWVKGLTPQAEPGMTFRTQNLTITERMRVSRKVGLRAELAVQSARGSGQTQILRLGVRPASASDLIEDAVMLVQFYGKEVSRRSAHVIPRPIGFLKVELPALSGTHWNFCKLPPVSAEQPLQPYIGGQQYQGPRLEYYGAVISIFDAEKSLVYQAITAPSLAAVAPEILPTN